MFHRYLQRDRVGISFALVSIWAWRVSQQYACLRLFVHRIYIYQIKNKIACNQPRPNRINRVAYVYGFWGCCLLNAYQNQGCSQHPLSFQDESPCGFGLANLFFGRLAKHGVLLVLVTYKLRKAQGITFVLILLRRWANVHLFFYCCNENNLKRQIPIAEIKTQFWCYLFLQLLEVGFWTHGHMLSLFYRTHKQHVHRLSIRNGRSKMQNHKPSCFEERLHCSNRFFQLGVKDSIKQRFSYSNIFVYPERDEQYKAALSACVQGLNTRTPLSMMNSPTHLVGTYFKKVLAQLIFFFVIWDTCNRVHI